MTRPAITADFTKSLDAHLHLMAKLTLDAMLLFDSLAKPVGIHRREVLRPYRRVNVE
jgi:hypothetical protein